MIEGFMRKLLLFVIILAITVFISYKYSRRVYAVYLKFYYNKMYTEHELLDKAQKMYDSKMYEELNGLIGSLLIVYPTNDEFKRIGALNYIKLGDVLKSAEVLAQIDDESIKHRPIYEEILKNLYCDGYYTDLLYFYSQRIMLDNINAAFYYGVSLYKKERYDESYKMLMYAKSKNFSLPELNFYIGLNLEKKGDISEAIKYVKSAFDSDMSNSEYKKKLADLYRQKNMFKEAEVILRSLR
jgi:tetratricopeptide (TPR) repeat protein